jgi:hypothetical protein
MSSAEQDTKGPKERTTKLCPFCAEEIQEAAIVCRYCGRDLPRHEVPTVAAGRRAVTSAASHRAPRSPNQLDVRVLAAAVLMAIVVGIVVAALLLRDGKAEPSSIPSSSFNNPFNDQEAKLACLEGGGDWVLPPGHVAWRCEHS